MARKNGPGGLTYLFQGAYDFGDVQFSHGGGKVEGAFSGTVEDRAAMLAIAGESLFKFSDVFADPLDLGIEPGGTPYAITGEWTAVFSAVVAKDRARSVYFWQGQQ